jgi:hypothetical protein
MSDRSVHFCSPNHRPPPYRYSASRPSTLQRRLAQIMFRLLAVAGITSSVIAPGRCEAIACKPLLTITSVGFSEVRSLQRQWTAVLLADVSYCATSWGRFEIDFIRVKEHGPDMQFTKQFAWTAGQFEVTVDFWADEAVLDYRIGFIAPCVCRD